VYNAHVVRGQLLLFTIGGRESSRGLKDRFPRSLYLVDVCEFKHMRIVCWFVHVERSGWNAAGKHAVEFNKIDRRPWGRKDGRGRVERTGPRSRIAMWPGHSRPSPPVVIRASSPRRTRNMSGGRDGPRGCWSSGRCNRKSEWNVSAKEKGNL